MQLRSAAVTALVAALLIPNPQLLAQLATDVNFAKSPSLLNGFGAYKSPRIAQADLADTPRVEALIRDGKLYLSLADAIALAVENNLDIATARFSPQEADTDILRALAGENLSGVQTQISTLSTGQSAATPGGGSGGGLQGQATGITQSASASAQGAGNTQGNAASFFGTQVTQLDPRLTFTSQFSRSSNPQSSSFVTAANTLVQDVEFYTTQFSQGFTTGTTMDLSWTTFNSSNNNLRNEFNPTTQGDFTLNVTQRLTQGLGRRINRRNIEVAKLNREVTDLAFEQQLITTISQIQNLYWDLVSLRDEQVARQADLDLALELVAKNERQVELGLLAGVEVVRARTQATNFRRQLVQVRANIKQQETVVKNALSKAGPISATLSGVEIIPTDSIAIPAVLPVQPLQDLVALAKSAQPGIQQTRIQLQTADINLKGVRNALLPTVDVTGFATNNGLAGRLNPDFIPSPGQPPANQFFVGGLGSVLGQMFRRNFPDYGVRFQVNVPLRNRRAQADVTRELLRRRQQDVQLRQQENTIEVDVEQAVVNINRAHEDHGIAREARELQQQLVDAEIKRFTLGKTTIFQLVQEQQSLATSRVTEIGAMNTFVKAQVTLDRLTAQTLKNNNVSIAEAYSGRSSRRPDPIPPTQ